MSGEKLLPGPFEVLDYEDTNLLRHLEETEPEDLIPEDRRQKLHEALSESARIRRSTQVDALTLPIG